MSYVHTLEWPEIFRALYVRGRVEIWLACHLVYDSIVALASMYEFANQQTEVLTNFQYDSLQYDPIMCWHLVHIVYT